MSKRITITIEDDDENTQQTPKINVWPTTQPSYTDDDNYLNNTNRTVPFPGSQLYNYDPCATCPNNTKNGGSGVCCCALPYFYGPYKVTC